MGAVPAWLSKYLIDDVLVNKNARMMVLVIVGIFVATITKVLTGYFASISSNYVTETIKRDIIFLQGYGMGEQLKRNEELFKKVQNQLYRNKHQPRRKVALK